LLIVIKNKRYESGKKTVLHLSVNSCHNETQLVSVSFSLLDTHVDGLGRKRCHCLLSVCPAFSRV